MKNQEHRYQELANFLKTRRARLSPAQVGLPEGTRRRSPGVRREEVAQLAGVGLTWYTWLEQGRSIRASDQVLESLARVRLLDDNERLHLFQLAQQRLPPASAVGQETSSSALQQVLDNLLLCPAYVMDQRWNVIAWNRAACLLVGDIDKMKPRERNILWRMFASVECRQLFVHWEDVARGMLARFRAACGRYIEDPWFAQFVEELKHESPEFDQWWPRYDILGNTNGYKEFNHPVLGRLDFEHISFTVSESPTLQMVVHTPVPGTDTKARMQEALA
jgi:transcriptional regulator with XRE-family HTH domain